MEAESALDAIYEDVDDEFLDATDHEEEGAEAEEEDMNSGEGEHAHTHYRTLGLQESNAEAIGEDLEDGEIENVLDVAVKDSKDYVKQTRLQGHKKKRKGRSGRNKGKNGQNEDANKFISRIAWRLREKKHCLVESAVNKLGVQAIRELVKEVDAIERHGGQMTADGKRRRTPGGVLWNILKSRVHPNVYKEIMAKGKEYEKQERKDRMKQHRMEIDELRKVNQLQFSDPSPLLSGDGGNAKEKTGYLEEAPDGSRISALESNLKADPDSLPKSSDVQSAWTNAVKQEREKYEVRSLHGEEPLKKKSTCLADRLRMPVGYEDLVEPS